jgi:hypothetical protein
LARRRQAISFARQPIEIIEKYRNFVKYLEQKKQRSARETLASIAGAVEPDGR